MYHGTHTLVGKGWTLSLPSAHWEALGTSLLALAGLSWLSPTRMRCEDGLGGVGCASVSVRFTGLWLFLAFGPASLSPHWHLLSNVHGHSLGGQPQLFEVAVHEWLGKEGSARERA